MYIDPNTGGMLFQLLAVIFAALSGFVLVFSSRIRMFFAKLRRKTRETSDEQKDELSSPDTDLT